MRAYFLITVFIVMLTAICGGIYIVLCVPPTLLSMFALLFLAWAFLTLFLSTVLYMLARKHDNVDPRVIFRHRLRISFFVGAIFIILLILQKIFDLI